MQIERNRYITHLLLTICLLCASVIDSLSAQDAVEAPSQYMEGRGVFFRISGNGLEHPSYILGTVHTFPGDFALHVPGLMDVYDSIGQVACERKIIASQWPNDDSLPSPDEMREIFDIHESKYQRSNGKMRLFLDDLTAREADRCKGALNIELGIRDRELWTFKYLFTHITSVYEERIHDLFLNYGLDLHETGISFDEYLYSVMASRYNLPVIELDEEKPEKEVKASRKKDFDLLFDKKARRKDLSKLLCSNIVYYGDHFRSTQIQAEEYIKGSKIPGLLTDTSDRSDTDARNHLWMTKLPTLFQQTPTLVVVGLFHLHDSNHGEGILHQLERMGFVVERLNTTDFF